MAEKRGHPVEYQRTLANGYDSFKPPNDIQEGNLLAQWGHRYVLNLRPQEHYTRYFHPLEGGGPRTFRPVRGDQDVDSNGSIRANGLWRYSPDLREPATREFIYSEAGVTWTKEGVRPLQGLGLVVFKVNAANIITSAKISLGATGAAISISRDAGINWQKLAADSGQAQCLEEVAGVEEYLVKVELSGTNALLWSIAIETVTQLNRPALPRLIRGPNRIQVRLGPQVETTQIQPSIIGGNHKKTVYAERALDVDREPDFYKATLRPAEKGTPCYAIWKIQSLGVYLARLLRRLWTNLLNGSFVVCVQRFGHRLQLFLPFWSQDELGTLCYGGHVAGRTHTFDEVL
jgi:hypothetical protein